MHSCCVFFFLMLSVFLSGPVVAQGMDIQAKRIGYLEAGRFWLFDRTFTVFQQALARHPDIRCAYPEDAHKSPGWEPENMARLPQVASELMHRKDLDLIVGLGTAAVKALLVANTGQIPILGMGMADPVAAGVVTGISDSGVDNFTCRIVADRWSIMFRVFHDVVGFSTLGILYQNTPEGRVYASLDDAHAMASELGFTVLEYGGLSSAETDDECRAGLEHLRIGGLVGIVEDANGRRLVFLSEQRNGLVLLEPDIRFIGEYVAARNAGQALAGSFETVVDRLAFQDGVFSACLASDFNRLPAHREPP